MMDNKITLQNKFLNISVRLPGCEPQSQRFDSACMVEKVILNGKHSFCQPEQRDPKRVNTYGFGLCSEFMCPWSSDAKPGEFFPKLGVGVFKQQPEGGRFDKWKPYDLERFQKTWTANDSSVTFHEEPLAAMGIAAVIDKKISIYQNTLTVSTTVENIGQEKLELTEFQHNFVSIDDLPIGPGYRLDIPFDSRLADGGKWEFNAMDERGVPTEAIPSMLRIQGQSIFWNDKMDRTTFHKITEQADIPTLPEYKWTLSHEHSPARISEICHFVPAKFSLWGIEHTVSTEVHCRISLDPGERTGFSRTWLFEDDTTSSV